MTKSTPDSNAAQQTLQSPWHKSAPKCAWVLNRILDDSEAAGAERYQSEEYQEAWNDWAKYLVKRKSTAPLPELFESKTHPLAWGVVEAFDQGVSGDKVLDTNVKFDTVDGRMLRQWLDANDGSSAGDDAIADALEALAWCHALPRLAKDVTPADWWQLLERLIAMAVDASAMTPVEDGIASQLAGGELPLSLAYIFPEITACRKLASQARAMLSVGLVDLLDGQGMPHADELATLRPLLASWTRCRAMGQKMKKGCFNSEAEQQYQWLIRQALRLSRADGSAVFSCVEDGRDAGRKSHSLESQCDIDLLNAAVAFGDSDDCDIFEQLFNKQNKKTALLTLPDASYHSEWAAVGVLRPGWSAAGPAFTTLYDGREAVDVELSCGQQVVFSGPWSWQVTLNGKPLTPLSDWEEICWATDCDGDYLELELALSNDAILQRHMFMAREDGFLLLADSVLCHKDDDIAEGNRKKPHIEYRATLPFCPGVDFVEEQASREGVLAAKKKNLARILPLAFAQWRECESPGALRKTNDGLELTFSVQADGLFAPLWFDLDRRRLARHYTWRRLTVAESLAKQAEDVAVGYRVQSGKEQWLVYRSLAQQANRTLLGHNLSSEMLVARFDQMGEVETLLEIE